MDNFKAIIQAEAITAIMACTTVSDLRKLQPANGRDRKVNDAYYTRMRELTSAPGYAESVTVVLSCEEFERRRRAADIRENGRYQISSSIKY